ncbi:hypothetical protein [Oryzihumus leptocrescens]|uniref:hypothetical protein n=1 Tax=Oryzihumus leptocrescens TaxID=297536 RepID=UPI00163B4130|nr:hypothetical protein [Oryzihumus leptocrescens]
MTPLRSRLPGPSAYPASAVELVAQSLVDGTISLAELDMMSDEEALLTVATRRALPA